MDVARAVRVALLRLRSLARRSSVERELDDELRDHVERHVEALVEQGMDPHEARTRAMRALGGVESLKETVRDTRRVGLVEDLARDVAYGARVLRRSPAFTFVAAVSLALGVGANTAIFQLLDAVRLRPLAVPRPAELHIVEIKDRGWAPGGYAGAHSSLTNPQWERLRDRQEAFSSIFAWTQSSFDLSERGESRFSDESLLVSGGYFETLGATPALGRLLTRDDDVRGCGDPPVVVSHGFWTRELGSRPDIAGTRLTINGRRLRIVGVTAAGFHGAEMGRAFEIAVPLCAEPVVHAGSGRLDAPSQWFLGVMGRLKDGWSVEQARAHLAGLSPDIFRETLPPSFSATQQKAYLSYTLIPAPGAAGFNALRAEYDRPLWMLLGVAGIVLVIACANLANLMFARVAAREREMAVRLALGASRRRVVRQLLIESVMLAALGTCAGAWLARMLASGVIAMMAGPGDPLFIDLAMNWRIFAFTAGLAVTATVLFGLAPALGGTRLPVETALRASSRALTPGGGRITFRRALVVAQLAMSLMLLVGGLLFARTLYNLSTVDPGFERTGVLEVAVDFTRLKLEQPAVRAHRVQLLDTLRAAPGIRAAAIGNLTPLVGIWSSRLFVDGKQSTILTNLNGVSPGYFATTGTPLIAGRDFYPSDDIGAPRVAVVNEAFVSQVLRAGSAGSAIGRIFQREDRGLPGDRHEIVGVVRNTKYLSLRDDDVPIAYFSQAQASFVPAFVRMFARVDDTARGASAIRQALDRYELPVVFHIRDFEDRVAGSFQRERLMGWLCGFFALLAAVLAIVGVYGVVSYSVQQRRVEVGVRLALGSTRAGILGLMLRESAAVIATGIGIGLALTWAASGLTASMLFEVRPTEPWVYLAAAAMLGGVGVIATVVPAWRAARLSPVGALRAD